MTITTRANRPFLHGGLIATIGCSVFLMACAQTMRFNASDMVPGAKGQVSITRDKNHNYHLDLRVFHLAEASLLQPPRQLYIVWMETAGNEVKNIGQLTTASSMLSKTMKSVLQTVTAIKPSKIYITAEDDASLQQPQGSPVLTTGND